MYISIDLMSCNITYSLTLFGILSSNFCKLLILVKGVTFDEITWASSSSSSLSSSSATFASSEERNYVILAELIIKEIYSLALFGVLLANFDQFLGMWSKKTNLRNLVFFIIIIFFHIFVNLHLFAILVSWGTFFPLVEFIQTNNSRSSWRWDYL